MSSTSSCPAVISTSHHDVPPYRLVSDISYNRKEDWQLEIDEA